MKRLIYLFVAVVLGLTSCDGQSRENSKAQNVTSNAPKTNVKVNKEYDKEGNLIRYDSTYSYYYSSIENDSLMADSVFSQFKNMFNNEFPFSNKTYFNQLFFEDSLLDYDFYKNDFFYNRFKKNMSRMDEMFLQMDSLKNSFFKEQMKENHK